MGSSTVPADQHQNDIKNLHLEASEGIREIKYHFKYKLSNTFYRGLVIDFLRNCLVGLIYAV